MTELDLSSLERAAARAGLPGLSARLVPPDPRRTAWFRWGGGTLSVSESIVDRCSPPDAAALLVNAILRERAARRVHLGAGALALGAVVLALLVDGVTGVLLLAAAAVAWTIGTARAALAADDATVALLGDAEALVRGLNAMGQEEIRVGRLKLTARPDLHERAERLVRRHALCADDLRA